MSKRLSIAICILAAAIAVVLVWGWHGGNPKEPVHDGRALSLWLGDYIIAPPDSPARARADEAIRRIGTNAIPFLLQDIRAQDPPRFVPKLLDLARRRGISIRYRSPRRRHEEAEYGFRVLGTNAACAVLELIKISKETRYPASQEYAARVLGQIGPAARAAIPGLLANFTHTNDDVRFAAVTASYHIGGEPDVLVPALTAALKDSRREVRFNAVAGLRRFGARASSAIPALLQALQDQSVIQDQHLRYEMENILWDLVPEKIAKPLVVEEATPMVVNGVTTEALSQRPWGGNMPDGKLATLVPKGKPVRCKAYVSVGHQPLYLYRGVTLTSAQDHFLGHFEVLGVPPPPADVNIEVVYVVDHQQIFLCARDYYGKRFLELRRVENKVTK